MKRTGLCILLLLVLVSCSRREYYIATLPESTLQGPTQLSICDDPDKTATIDPEKPVYLFVHGCNSSGGIEFRALAQVFEFHDQQTLCFNYNDRESMEKSSAQLVKELNWLTSKIGVKQVTLLGYSQGGLVTRRAMIKNRPDQLVLNPNAHFQLVTIASPFSGIQASSDCGKTYLHLLSFGVTVGVCQFIAGSKWTEIYPGSDFMENPGELPGHVSNYLKVVTDERNTCRSFDNAGACIEDDFVFSIPEQYHQKIDTDHRIDTIQVKAGHVEIVGDKDTAPKKLIAILQKEAILNQTDPQKKESLKQLLSFLY